MTVLKAKMKILCVSLSLMLIVGVTPFAYADETKDIPDQSNEITLSENDDGLDSEAADQDPMVGKAEESDKNVSESTETGDSFGSVDTVIEDDRAGIEYVEDEIIVVFKAETSSGEAAEVIERNETVVEDTFNEDLVIEKEAVVVEIEEGTTVAEAVEELTQDPKVEYAQPNFLYYTAEIDDGSSDLSTQAEVTINDPEQDKQWALGATKLYETWGLVQTNRAVGVAVIDTGVNINHEDLKDNIPDGFYYDATKNGKTGDLDGHGTQGLRT